MVWGCKSLLLQGIVRIKQHSPIRQVAATGGVRLLSCNIAVGRPSVRHVLTASMQAPSSLGQSLVQACMVTMVQAAPTNLAMLSAAAAASHETTILKQS
jgi:hypothetical protein